MISRRQATCKANLENQGNGCQDNENMDSDTCDGPSARHKRHRPCNRVIGYLIFLNKEG